MTIPKIVGALVVTVAASLTALAPAFAGRASMGQWASILAPAGQGTPLCYDAVVVGRQDDYANVEALSDILPGIWLGARSDVRITVVSSLRGGPLPRIVWVRLVETSMRNPGTTRLFVLRKIAERHYWAADWTNADASATSELLGALPPRCAE